MVKSAIIINNTKYIPAKDAEVGFLIAILGMVTGIVFGFFVLKLNFGTQSSHSSIPQSIPATTYEQTTPIKYEETPQYNINDQEEVEEGLRDYSV